MACASGANTYAYFDKTIPIEEQSLLHPFNESYTIKSFDGMPVSWKGGYFTENLYYIPAGMHTIVFDYYWEWTNGNTKRTSYINDVVISYNFLPNRIYTLFLGTVNGKDTFYITLSGFTELYVPSEGETMLVILGGNTVRVDDIQYGLGAAINKTIRVAVRNGEHIVDGLKINATGETLYFRKSGSNFYGTTIRQISPP
jgi:hypothetical protein